MCEWKCIFLAMIQFDNDENINSFHFLNDYKQ